MTSPPSLRVGSWILWIQWQNSAHSGLSWLFRPRALYSRQPGCSAYVAQAESEAAPRRIRVGHDDKGSLALQLLGDPVLPWERQQFDGRLTLRVDGDNAVPERSLLARAEEARAELHLGIDGWNDIGDDAGFLEAARETIASVARAAETAGVGAGISASNDQARA